MDILRLNYFIRAAELNSISRTASEYNVRPSSVSNQITALEKELGVQLFDRKGKSLHLNESGEIVYRHATRVMEILSDASKEIADREGMLNYELSVATMTIPKVMPYVIQGFRNQYPNIHISVSQYQQVRDIHSIGCDVMLYSSNEETTTEYSRTIYVEPIFLIVSRHHPLAKQEEVLPSQLKDESFVASTELSDFGRRTIRMMKELNLEQKPSIVSDYPSFIMDLVAANEGISFIPSLTYRYYHSPDLVPVGIKDYHPVRYINISWSSRRYHSRAADIFIQYATQFMADLDDRISLTEGGEVR